MTPPARLLGSHRNDLVNLLILGGAPAERGDVARAFHERSRTRGGRFVGIDARLEEERLRAGLAAWIAGGGGDRWPDPLGPAEHGTLFIDSIGALPLETQRMLLAFVRRRADHDLEPQERVWVGRLAAGSGEPLSAAVARGRFSSALYDSLDKLRVELPRTPERGRGAARSCSRIADRVSIGLSRIGPPG